MAADAACARKNQINWSEGLGKVPEVLSDLWTINAEGSSYGKKKHQTEEEEGEDTYYYEYTNRPSMRANRNRTVPSRTTWSLHIPLSGRSMHPSSHPYRSGKARPYLLVTLIFALAGNGATRVEVRVCYFIVQVGAWESAGREREGARERGMDGLASFFFPSLIWWRSWRGSLFQFLSLFIGSVERAAAAATR